MSSKPDMSIDIAGIRMKNPVMTASGTFGYGPEYADLVDLNALGAIVVKGISSEPWGGNDTPRMVEVPGGLVNAIGLQNPGAEKFIEEYIPFLSDYDVPVIVNIWGKTIEEYSAVASSLSVVDGVHGLEVNISCPNIKAGGIAFGTNPEMAAEVISAVRESTKLPLIPKLPPNVPDIKALAVAVEKAGADAVSLINTMPAMVIDTETRRPVLSNKIGGLSGPAVHPIAVKLVCEAASAIDIPVIGMGGIVDTADAIELIIAGASAVAVGTATFANPAASVEIVDGIERWLSEHGVSSVAELVGTVQM